MMKVAKVIFFLLIIVVPAYGRADEVKIYLDESRTDFIMAEKMDCTVYKSKKGITIGFKAGMFLFGIGPEVSFGGEDSIKWEKVVQGIIARYKELCARFNTGTMTKKEYDERIKEIDAIAKETMEFQERMVKGVKDNARITFEQLGYEVERHATQKEAVDGIARLLKKLEGLTPLPTKNE